MSEFNLYAPVGANKKKKILGRGSSSGRGTTAGKGTKGQQSRSGRSFYVGFEGGQMPLYRRIAKRGFSNKAFRIDYEIYNLCDIEKKFKDGETVNKQTLIQKGLLKKANALVKILGNGDITKKLTFSVDKISASAQEKIIKAGGSIVDKQESSQKNASKIEKDN